MRNELEDNFGRALQGLVAHLIKNAKKVPEPVLQGALDFEKFTWGSLDDETKRRRLRAIAELTQAPSDVNRHIEAYPHSFSKNRYAEYLEFLRLYAKSLGI
jgi:hypothetical protein